MKHADSPFQPTRCTRCGTQFDIAPGVETECPKCGCLKKIAPASGWGITQWGILICSSFLALVFVLVALGNQGVGAKEAGGAAGIATMAGASILLWLLLFVVCVVLYFLPSAIAARRNHRNLVALFAANLLLGWTFLGWVGCLIWSLIRARDTDASAV